MKGLRNDPKRKLCADQWSKRGRGVFSANSSPKDCPVAISTEELKFFRSREGDGEDALEIEFWWKSAKGKILLHCGKRFQLVLVLKEDILGHIYGVARRGEADFGLLLNIYGLKPSFHCSFISQFNISFSCHEIESSCGDQRQSILDQVRLVWTLGGIEQPRCWSLLGWCAFPTSSVITVITAIIT